MCAAESLTWPITFTACGTRQSISQRCRYVYIYIYIYIYIYPLTNEMFALDDINKILSALSHLNGDCLFVYLKTFTHMHSV